MKLHVKTQKIDMKHESGCIICGDKLNYTEPTVRECSVCHKMKMADAVCTSGHYVCDECHTASINTDIQTLLLESSEKDPVRLFNRLINRSDVHMHGPEHHGIVPCTLLTAYRNNGGVIDLDNAMTKAINRAKQISGGSCAYWGACGAAVGAGIYISIVTGANPLSKEWWSAPQLLVSRCLNKNAEIGGVRCCKRTSYTAILEAVRFTAEYLGADMPAAEFTCGHSAKNKECLGIRCPYN